MRDLIGAFLAFAAIGAALDVADDALFVYEPLSSSLSNTVSELNSNILPDAFPLRLGSTLMFGGLAAAGILYLASMAQ